MKPDKLSQSVTHALLRTHSYLTEPGVEGPPPSRPITITISREVGALGGSLARELGEQLGWPVYDKEILNAMAEHLEAPESDLSKLDERVISWLEELATCLVNKKHISPYAYLKHLVATVRGLGETGHCIIVGRGANCILPLESTLRVRLVADLPDRIRFMAARLETSEKEAEKHIKTLDPERERFVRQNFGKDPVDAHEYDIVLSTSRLSVAECAAAVIALLKKMEARVEEHDKVSANK